MAGEAGISGPRAELGVWGNRDCTAVWRPRPRIQKRNEGEVGGATESRERRGGRSPPHPPPALRNSLPATWRAACWAHSCALDSAWAAVVTYHRLGPGTTVTSPQSQTFLLIWFLVCRRLLGISSYGLSSKCAGWEGEGEGREQAPVSLLIQTLIL